ncbi:MAG: hypothetical protein H6721_12435 [Sandaracinus sp.]|nr:hypothetical protein [Sandaracinus sp.]
MPRARGHVLARDRRDVRRRELRDQRHAHRLQPFRRRVLRRRAPPRAPWRLAIMALYWLGQWGIARSLPPASAGDRV